MTILAVYGLLAAQTEGPMRHTEREALGLRRGLHLPESGNGTGRSLVELERAGIGWQVTVTQGMLRECGVHELSAGSDRHTRDSHAIGRMPAQAGENRADRVKRGLYRGSAAQLQNCIQERFQFRALIGGDG